MKKIILDTNFLLIGIQGDKGSSNERACMKFCKRNIIKDYKIRYLISTENVLKELNKEKINLGIFAVKSSRKGVVKETEKAIKKHSFEKIDEIKLGMDHVLLGIKKIDRNEYKKIVSHPQALQEHRKYLIKEYPQAKLIEAVDTALPARKLKEGKYDDKTLIIASKSCSKIYGLKIIEDNLPTNKGYVTTFYLVKKSNRLMSKKIILDTN